MKLRAATVIYQIAGMLLISILLLCLRASDITPSQARTGHRTTLTPLLLPIATPLPATATPTSSARRTYRVSTRLNVAYGPLADERLDLCVPRAPATMRPGIILLHGGGWVGGDKNFYDQFCTSLAAHGFVAATVNYRLAPTYIWPAQLVDAQLAVRWLRSQASQLMLDTKRICAYGRSAGAQLALFLGTLSTIHDGDEAGLLANEAPNVSCVVDLFGPTDLMAMRNTAYQRTLVETLLGGATLTSQPAGGVARDSDLAPYYDASPLFAITAQSAPTLIVQGTEDSIVPPDQAWELNAKLEQLHVPVQFISYEGDHSYGGLNINELNRIQDEIFAYLVAQEQP